MNYFLQLFILQTNDNTPPSETLQQVKTVNYFYETEWRLLNPTMRQNSNDWHQDGGAENKGEVNLNQEQAVVLKQCRNRAYSKVD